MNLDPGQAAVLIVDDEPWVVQLLADILGADGHQVETAPDGLGALDKLGMRRYDVVVSDMRMPRLDGFGLYRELAQRYPHLTRRFVLITGSALSPEAQQFVERTGAPTLSKPFNMKEVCRVVRRVLSS